MHFSHIIFIKRERSTRDKNILGPKLLQCLSLVISFFALKSVTGQEWLNYSEFLFEDFHCLYFWQLYWLINELLPRKQPCFSLIMRRQVLGFKENFPNGRRALMLNSLYMTKWKKVLNLPQQMSDVLAMQFQS